MVSENFSEDLGPLFLFSSKISKIFYQDFNHKYKKNNSLSFDMKNKVKFQKKNAYEILPMLENSKIFFIFPFFLA